MAREFLKLGSTVILSANSKPALNDVTHVECQQYFNHAGQMCSVIEEALTNKRLMFYESGGTGPCLDLANLHPGTRLYSFIKRRRYGVQCTYI